MLPASVTARSTNAPASTSSERPPRERSRVAWAASKAPPPCRTGTADRFSAAWAAERRACGPACSSAATRPSSRASASARSASLASRSGVSCIRSSSSARQGGARDFTERDWRRERPRTDARPAGARGRSPVPGSSIPSTRSNTQRMTKGATKSAMAMSTPSRPKTSGSYGERSPRSDFESSCPPMTMFQRIEMTWMRVRKAATVARVLRTFSCR